MRLSAIIPTHNRPTELRRCLESLEKQTSAASEIEVIVIDDGSDTDIGSVVAELATMGPVAMLFSSAARLVLLAICVNVCPKSVLTAIV